MDDAISRQKMINTVNNLRTRCDNDIDAYRDLMVAAIEALPPSPSRPHGHWVKHHESKVGIVYCCDQCGRTLQALSWETRKDVCKMYPFCHCGADMRS